MKARLNELALFAGAGGGVLGGHLLGWRTICAVELDAYAAAVLAQRQNDGLLEPFPIWSDVQTFDGRPWRGIVDVVSGGFPCQDISAAGKGAGIDGERSGLWVEMARIIREVRPRFALVENSPMLTSRGLGRVLGDLAEMGMAARWGVLGACDAGAPHKRERIWIVAYDQEHGWGPGRARRSHTGRSRQPVLADPSRILEGRQEQRPERERVGACGESIDVADADSRDEHGRAGPVQVGRIWRQGEIADARDAGRIEWLPEPDVGRVAHGVAWRVERLCALGNGQVPSVAAMAWRILTMPTLGDTL